MTAQYFPPSYTCSTIGISASISGRGRQGKTRPHAAVVAAGRKLLACSCGGGGWAQHEFAQVHGHARTVSMGPSRITCQRLMLLPSTVIPHAAPNSTSKRISFSSRRSRARTEPAMASGEVRLADRPLIASLLANCRTTWKVCYLLE